MSRKADFLSRCRSRLSISLILRLSACLKGKIVTKTSVMLAALLPGVLFTSTASVRAETPIAKTVRAAKPATPPARVTSIGIPGMVPGSTEETKALLSRAPKSEDYPNAASAMLLDLSDITVGEDGATRTIVRQTKKIFNKRGRDGEAEIKIPYNSATETIRIVRARTIKPDGTIINVRPEDIRDSRPSDYDDVAVKAFSMPAVDDDSIIDYEYETVEKEPQMAGNFWSQWYFQGGFDPVLFTKLTVTLPKTLKLNQTLMNTAVKPIIVNAPDGKTVSYTWEDKNVAPLELEPMMPSPEKVLPRLAITTVPSWQAVADWYNKLAEGRDAGEPNLRAQVLALTKGKQTTEEKAKAVFYYVQEKTRYVAIELGKGAYQPRPASSVLANQYGDCKDMATLLVSMLREAGVTAYPVLLEMASKEVKSEKLPSPGEFNHAICLAEIDGKKFWLDATGAICPWGTIPTADRGCNVLVIRNGKGQFETIPDGTPDDNRNERIVKLELQPDGSAKGTLTLAGSGDLDMALRSVLRDLPESKRRIWAESVAQGVGANARVSNVTVSDYKNLDKPVSVTMDVTFPSWANNSGDLLLFKAKPDQTSGASSSPFREDFRKNPVSQMSPALGSSTLVVTLPKGYTVLSVPKPMEVKSDLGKFTRTVEQSGDTLTITTRGENYKAEVPASRYSEVKKYYEDYLKASDESVIVKKS